MTNMQEVKYYLSRVRNIDKEIDAMQSAVDEFDSRLTVIKSSKVKDVNVQGGPGAETIEDRVVKYMAMGDDINTKIDEMVDLKNKIFKEIDNLNDRVHKTILIRRYIISESWDDIALQVSYTKQHVTKLHGKALQEFYEINKKEVDAFIEEKLVKDVPK